MGLKWYGEAIQREVDRAAEHGLDDLAQNMVDHTRKRFRSGPQTGRDYRGWVFFRKGGKLRAFKSADATAGYKSAYVRSSAPGEYPAHQSGDLADSMAWLKTGKLRRIFGTSEKHGLWLELGTKYMRPRPFLRPTYRHFMGHDTEVQFDGKMK
jgi:hypothetical protein